MHRTFNIVEGRLFGHTGTPARSRHWDLGRGDDGWKAMEGVMKRLAVLALAGLALSACNATQPPPRVAVAPAPVASDDILWARKDGQRMATNPVLLEQGTRDKALCAQEASGSGALDFPVFASCMDRAGYRQIRRGA
jgi:hypothetical protein